MKKRKVKASVALMIAVEFYATLANNYSIHPEKQLICHADLFQQLSLTPPFKAVNKDRKANRALAH